MAFADRKPTTKAERQAKLQKQAVSAEKNMPEKKKVDEAFRANFERLKAERRARES
jgi:hypothetical protein